MCFLLAIDELLSCCVGCCFFNDAVIVDVYQQQQHTWSELESKVLVYVSASTAKKLKAAFAYHSKHALGKAAPHLLQEAKVSVDSRRARKLQ
jgi:hypothetical protein